MAILKLFFLNIGITINNFEKFENIFEYIFEYTRSIKFIKKF